jgi:hypothetical protein
MMLSETSSRVFAAGLVVAAVALALTLRQNRVQRDFSPPTKKTMGVVLRKGALLGKSRRSSTEYFCWVSYEFTPAAGGAPQRSWGLWQPGCGSAPGRMVPIEYVVAHPEVNRPEGGGFSFPPLLLWFATGVILVVGFILRRSEEDNSVSRLR